MRKEEFVSKTTSGRSFRTKMAKNATITNHNERVSHTRDDHRADSIRALTWLQGPHPKMLTTIWTES